MSGTAKLTLCKRCPERVDVGRLKIMSSITPAKEPPMSATKDHPLRVIQWTTGNIGRRSLHAIIGRPDMELVGVYAHGQDKVGVDAAELSGWPEPTGVKATNDIDALLALRPDACCYNPLWPSVDELVRLLESGHQRVLQRGLDHRRQADAAGPAADPRRLRAGRLDDFRQRRTPRDDEPGRHGAQRVLRTRRRDPHHRIGGLLYLRIGGNPDGDGFLAGPRHPRAGRERATRK